MKRPLEWQIATVSAIKPETANVKTLTLTLPAWLPHRAGQHYDVRLSAPDGYQAQRSYSIASAPERMGDIDLTVERLEDGEVSSYLDDVLVVGDQLEVRGPIGGYFVWEVAMGGPLLLIAQIEAKRVELQMSWSWRSPVSRRCVSSSGHIGAISRV